MGTEKQVYHDADGVRRTVFFDRDEPTQFGIFTEADMTSVVETNKALAETQDPRSTNRHVARVPMTIYEQSVREDWDEGDWKKWLNDPDNKAFRIWPGRV